MEQQGTRAKDIMSESEDNISCKYVFPACGENQCVIGGSVSECCGGNAVTEPLPPTPDAIEDLEDSSLFKGLLAKVKSRVTSAGISVTTVTTVLKYSMEVVELSEVTGVEQRDLALDIVKRVIDDTKMSHDTRAACNAVLDSGVLVGVVDIVVDATKGKLSINVVKKKSNRCLKGFGCISGGK